MGGKYMFSSNKVISFFEDMQMCLDFDTSKKVSEKDMKTILEVGRLSPSSFGLEPWKFLVIENEYIKNEIYKKCWGMRKEASIGSYIVVMLARKSVHMKYNSEYVRYIMEEIQGIPSEEINIRLDRYKIFLEDDFNIMDDDRALFDWSSKQSYIPLTNMMTAASALGVDSCPVEGFNKDRLEDYLEHENLLDREDFGVSTIVSFGYKKAKSLKQRNRRDFNKVVNWID